jgi:enoyl-[acyl-carrier protein] reductase I
MQSMQGKNAVIFGVANKRSIAWAIAQSLSQAGAKLAVTYMNERMKAEAYDLIASLSGAEPFQCDVSSDAEINQLFGQLKERYGRLDALAHCVAYAPAEDMKGDFLNTSREGFRIAHDISAYSLIAVTRASAPLMTEGGSVITLTYFGAEKVVRGYNMTLAARGVGDFRDMLKNHAEHAPLKRNVDVKEVADTALFLCSPAGSGITGETIYVDCGYNIMGF